MSGLFDASQGSSPHVRGARLERARNHGRLGIIPACAGSTRLFRHNDDLYRDHPRMCGEHALMASKMPVNAGSSPHVRGALLSCLRVVHRRGIIPACAGSTVP